MMKTVVTLLAALALPAAASATQAVQQGASSSSEKTAARDQVGKPVAKPEHSVLRGAPSGTAPSGFKKLAGKPKA